MVLGELGQQKLPEQDGKGAPSCYPALGLRNDRRQYETKAWLLFVNFLVILWKVCQQVCLVVYCQVPKAVQSQKIHFKHVFVTFWAVASSDFPKTMIGLLSQQYCHSLSLSAVIERWWVTTWGLLARRRHIDHWKQLCSCSFTKMSLASWP